MTQNILNKITQYNGLKLTEKLFLVSVKVLFICVQCRFTTSKSFVIFFFYLMPQRPPSTNAARGKMPMLSIYVTNYVYKNTKYHGQTESCLD